MTTALSIGLIGDFSPEVGAHRAIPRALELAAAAQGLVANGTWLHTSALVEDIEAKLNAHDGLWCVPGSPYANMAGALRAIRFARELPCPFLGTCGGFQHALLEYARHVLGWIEADHLESNPQAALPLISALSCSMVGVTGLVRLQPGSAASRIYGRTETREQYHCNFGLNSAYLDSLGTAGLRFSGFDDPGEARIFELIRHPFFLATLFQPELSALTGRLPHPIVSAFVQAAAAYSSTRRRARSGSVS